MKKVLLLKEKIKINNLKEHIAKLSNFIDGSLTFVEKNSNGVLYDTIIYDRKSEGISKRSWYQMGDKKLESDRETIIILVEIIHNNASRLAIVAEGDTRKFLPPEFLDNSFAFNLASKMKRPNFKQITKTNITSNNKTITKLGNPIDNTNEFLIDPSFDIIDNVQLQMKGDLGMNKKYSISVDSTTINIPLKSQYYKIKNEVQNLFNISKNKEENQIALLNKIQKITNAETIKSINEKLFSSIKNEEYENITIDFMDMDSFNYTDIKVNNKNYDFLSVDILKDIPKQISYEDLYEKKVFYNIETYTYNTSLGGLITFSYEKNNSLLIKHGNDYFEASKSYAKEVDSIYNNLPFSDIGLDWKKDWSEDKYNEEISRLKKWINIDRKYTTISKNTIEIADLWNKKEEVYTVKQFHSSSNFSHISTQAVIGANIITLEKENVRKWASNHKIINFDPDKIKKYGILIGKRKIVNGKPDLPFLSKSMIVSLWKSWSYTTNNISLKFYYSKIGQEV